MFVSSDEARSTRRGRCHDHRRLLRLCIVLETSFGCAADLAGTNHRLVSVIVIVVVRDQGPPLV
jgi:hypothetical protein